MNYTYLIFFFILGTILASFYCVVGIRLPKKEDFIFSRSRCDICNHELKFYELIPIISYIFQRGRCRYCHKKIGFFMPMLEIITGLLFMVSFYSFGMSYNLFIALGIVSILIIISVSDITYMVIPDEVLIFFSIYFIVIQYLNLGLIGCLEHIIYGLFLFLLMYLIMLLGNKIFKKESLGGGDIKLMFIFGLILNPILGALSIFIASLIALPISIIFLVKDNERVIPFGPFLLIGLDIIFFTKIDVNTIINMFNLI